MKHNKKKKIKSKELTHLWKNNVFPIIKQCTYTRNSMSAD